MNQAACGSEEPIKNVDACAEIGNPPAWQSNNTGVYKNFAVGYSTRYEDGLVIPPSFRVAASGAASGKTFRVLDPETTTVLFPNHDYYLVVGRFSPGVGFYEVVPRDRFPTPEALLANVLTSNQANAGRTYRMVVSGENIVVSSSYPDGAPFFSINGSTAAVAARHHTGTGQTAGFPLIEAQEVDGDYQFTGRFFACATGDGLLLVNSPSVGKRLVVDSRTNTAPRSCTQPFVVDDCPAILSGTVPPSVSCP